MQPPRPFGRSVLVRITSERLLFVVAFQRKPNLFFHWIYNLPLMAASLDPFKLK